MFLILSCNCSEKELYYNIYQWKFLFIIWTATEVLYVKYSTVPEILRISNSIFIYDYSELV